jgi:hypothetical protein
VFLTLKEVPVGELNTATPLAPFVSPNVAGRQINVAESGKVGFVKPAYLKPMVTIVPSDVQDSALVRNCAVMGLLQQDQTV